MLIFLRVECDITESYNMISQLALLKSAVYSGKDNALNHISQEAYEILSERFAEFNVSLDSFYKNISHGFLQNTYESFILMNSGIKC